ncbi:MAG: cytochrome c-type biogenesis protein [Gemmobacter sp.]
MKGAASGACKHAPTILAFAVALWAAVAGAVEPDEVLADPVLESRARALSRELRCVVCRTETIDESDAAIARDLRLLLRERLVAGDSDPQVLEFMVARYGEYVLLKPPARGANLVLWLAGPLMLLAGGGIALAWLRRRTAAEPAAPLTPEEERRLEEILRQ